MGEAGPRWLELLAHPRTSARACRTRSTTAPTSGATGYSEPFYIPSQPINQNGGIGNSSQAAVAPNLFNYLALPIDPNTGSPVNAGDALAVPNCLQLDHGELLYSISGLPQGHRNAYTRTGLLELQLCDCQDVQTDGAV